MTAPIAPTSLDLVFGALADPTRRAILERLAGGERSVMELVAGFELSQPAVSKHLKVLERSGLVTRAREGQFRPCRLNAGPLEEAAVWIAAYRRFWEDSLDGLELYVKELQRKEQQAQQTQQTQQTQKKKAPKTPKKETP